VRSQLLSNGLPADKIRAQGLGPSRPVADNNTAEGRANNRRVEIIVEPLGK
jgi:outer membrane protein OmpA-like peptidoglycan-associated protein